MRWVLLVLAACGSSSSRTDPIANARTPLATSTVCPQGIDHAPWLPIRFKDRACACTDTACGLALRDELRAWRDGLTDSIAYAEPDAQQNAAFGKLVIAATECIERTFVAKPRP
ncbi:MAG: hypothetical protein H0X17_05630 [Deltaproteobacteria bacterium]|nr:hypothetical protein [Deltaproteobacteria bacterium]